MRNTTTPLIMPSGRSTPRILHDLTVNFEAIKVGKCIRLADAAKMDIGIFLSDPSTFLPGPEYVALCVCKNWKTPISTSIANEIISKALGHKGACFCIISCFNAAESVLDIKAI